MSYDAGTYFTTNNGGYELVLNGVLKGAKRNLYYVYLDPNIYMQRYYYDAGAAAVASNNFNMDMPEITVETITKSDNGNISFN